MSFGALLALLSRRPVRWLLLILVAASAVPVCTEETFVIGERTLRLMEKRYGGEARTRLLAWQDLVRSVEGDERYKLERVNRFFNTITFVDDEVHWKKADHWATPIEFLASNGGDCEDFAIAKYFTLIKLGIEEERLTLTYVKALRLNKAHMVLTYTATPGAEPLVLDNLVDAIRPSSQRTDLLPVYSLNGSGLWLAKQRGKGKMIGGSERLQRWSDLLDRMTNEMEQDEEAP